MATPKFLDLNGLQHLADKINGKTLARFDAFVTSTDADTIQDGSVTGSFLVVFDTTTKRFLAKSSASMGVSGQATTYFTNWNATAEHESRKLFCGDDMTPYYKLYYCTSGDQKGVWHFDGVTMTLIGSVTAAGSGTEIDAEPIGDTTINEMFN